MRFLLSILIGLPILNASCLCAGSFEDDFAVVFIDEASEGELGEFPLDRSFYAKAILQTERLGAKAVVLKFFIDRPKNAESDQALAEAMKGIPVILQVRLLDQSQEPNPNPLPDRFTLPGVEALTGVAGDSGWFPLPILSANAADVGFVDINSLQIPLLESHRSRTVRSIVVNCIETATGKSASFETPGTIRFGDWQLETDRNQFVTAALPETDNIAYIPFHEFLALDRSETSIAGKVVIIGYDGPKIHEFPSPIGPIRAHRYFVHSLKSIYEQVEIGERQSEESNGEK